MTPAADFAALCRAAGLTVLAAEDAGTQVCVRALKVPQSASGLQALLARLDVGSVTVSTDAAGKVTIWFMRER